MPKSSKQKQTQPPKLQSQFDEWDSLFIKEILSGKYVPTPPPGWQPTKDITLTDKKESTPEEKFEKVADVVFRAQKKLLEIDYPHLMGKKD